MIVAGHFRLTPNFSLDGRGDRLYPLRDGRLVKAMLPIGDEPKTAYFDLLRARGRGRGPARPGDRRPQRPPAHQPVARQLRILAGKRRRRRAGLSVGARHSTVRPV